jgi:hypothetical protein
VFRLCSIILAWLVAASLTLADTNTGFEPALYTGSPPGIVLTGQDGWYNPVPGSLDYRVMTYAGNAFGFVQNPQGSSQFAAGLSNGGPAVANAERAEVFGSGDVWTITVDVAARFLGPAPATNNLGSFSLQDDATSKSFAGLMTWTNPATPTSWRMGYLVYDAAGVPVAQPGLFAGPQWQGLQVNRWYRVSTTFSLSANRVVSVSIRDLAGTLNATIHPSGWFLAGGAGSTLPPPTAFRLFTGGTGFGNVVGWDNLDMCPLQVTNVNPTFGQEGTSVHITGCGFGSIADDLSVLMLMPDGTAIPFTVVSATNSLIIANVGPVPPDAVPGPLLVARGFGQRGINTPALDDVIPENPGSILVFDRCGGFAPSPVLFNPFPTGPPIGQTWLFGRRAAPGVMELDVSGVWRPNTSLKVFSKLHGIPQGIGDDVQGDELRLRCGGDGLYLAERIADAVQTAYTTRGINSTASIVNIGPGAWRLTLTLLDANLVVVPIDIGTLTVVATEPSLISPFVIGPVTGFYQASLSQPGSAAQVNNVDLTGEDGATISPLVPTPIGVVAETLPIGLDAAGESVTVRSWGTFAGPIANQLVGSAKLVHVGSFFDVFADFGPAGTGQTRIEVWNCTAITGSMIVPNGQVAQLATAGFGLPQIVGCGGRPQVGPTGPFVWIDLDRIAMVTPTGGLPALGTQIRFYAQAPAALVTAMQALDIAAGLVDPSDLSHYTVFNSYEGGICYANCDGSSGTPSLTANDFACFLNAYASGQAGANCDGSTGAVLLTPNDFACFLNQFAGGCP